MLSPTANATLTAPAALLAATLVDIALDAGLAVPAAQAVVAGP